MNRVATDNTIAEPAVAEIVIADTSALDEFVVNDVIPYSLS